MRELIDILLEQNRNRMPLSVALSGIDGSGKGYIGQRLNETLRQEGVNSFLIGTDGWLELPQNRFSSANPALHFYKHGFRFEEMFRQLVNPLCENGTVDLIAKHSSPGNSTDFHDYHYRIDNAEILIFEGIFLLQRRFGFDFRIWIECSFGTALARAVQRNQEGLTEEQLRKDYNSIYFPSQLLHFRMDEPRKMANFVIANDTLD